VIGGGPGGYAAAFFAADMGLNVTLVDMEANPGGVCLFRGCIPSKALLHVAKVASEAKHATNWGLTYASRRSTSTSSARSRTAWCRKLTGGVGQLAKQRKINYIQGKATFVDTKTLSIEPVGKTAARRSR
jgi:dihydrolipoamide dehydrogenase